LHFAIHTFAHFLIDILPQAKKEDGSVLEKLVMVSWCPDDSKVRAKMIFGSTTNALKSKLGIDKNGQASSPSDVEEAVLRKLIGL